MDLYEEALLRPDEQGYAFARYFVYQEKSGDLEPRPGAAEEVRHRAKTTLRLLGLNKGGRPVARRARERDPPLGKHVGVVARRERHRDVLRRPRGPERIPAGWAQSSSIQCRWTHTRPLDAHG